MSSRIEDTDPLSLLCELSNNWAQTCIAQPSRRVLAWAGAIFNETRRVLRDDGVLWLLLDRREALPGYLAEQGWVRQPTPRWASPLTLRGSQLRLYLLSKNHHYFYNPHPAPRSSAGVACGARCGSVVCSKDTAWQAELIRRCILAGSSPVACGACGAPYTRPNVGLGRRATCIHSNPGGRCLVINPFEGLSALCAREAERSGRHFLGVRALREPPR